jgi:hypothetical protein
LRRLLIVSLEKKSAIVCPPGPGSIAWFVSEL